MSGTRGIPETELVLVAVLPEPRDLEIARVLGWYRIPLKSAPKIISVDYLAFYQTGKFAKAERWQISRIAKLKGHELTTRKELLRDQIGHPRANEEYYKLQLGPLIALQNPIPAGSWKRITFFYTTIGRLNKAQTMADLPVHDEERALIWQTLRQKAVQNNEHQAETLPEFPLDPMILALFGGLAKQ
ncbi:MAG: hypothetical protein VB108_08390 [Anaerolineaceae bacterium]|nr:hypothetical protein [Anaerolineaceae bacterium]